MLEWWTEACLAGGDALLGRLLEWSPDAALLAAAIASAVVLVAVRRWTTNQDLLRRAAADKRRLRRLLREARARGEKEAVRRLRDTRTQVALKQLRAEGLPVLASLLPIAALATWCLGRLEFHAPRAGEAVEVVARAPLSAAGELAHVVPEPGLRADGGWVRRLEASGDAPGAAAAWTLRCDDPPRQFALQLRWKRATYERELAFGGCAYAAPVVVHDPDVWTELRLRPYRPFGFVPGVPPYLPPWLTGYLLLTLPLVPLLKRAFRTW